MMRSGLLQISAILILLAGGSFVPGQTEGESLPDGEPSARIESAGTVTEARSRARILHETLHGSLQVMHRDFFREDEGLTIPSRSLEDVFSELKQSYDLELHWLAVDTPAMNVDHQPTGEMQLKAAGALKDGDAEFEAVFEDRYYFAGPIRLSATCLSCHLSRRSSNDDRAAGLMISMPLHTEPRD